MRHRSRRWSAVFLVFAGLSLLVIAGYSYFAPEPKPALEIVQTDIEVADCAVDQKREVVIHLYNRSNRSLRVLGLAEC